MKRIIAIMGMMAAATLSFAQNTAQSAAAEAAAALNNAPLTKEEKPKPNYWKESLKTNINFGQTSLNNWAAGGDNTTSLAAYIDGNANYKRTVTVNNKLKDMYWNNRLQLDYGFLYASSKPIIQKNTDRIYLESKWGYQINNKIYFSANFDFRSQFAKGYNYATPDKSIIANYDPLAGGIEDLSMADQRKAWSDARVAKSNLLSPAYTNIALGIDWKPASWFSASVAPLTGGFVISTDPQFRKGYSMALKCDETDAGYLAAVASGDAAAIGKYYKASRFELGAQVKIDAKFNINDNFSYTTQLVLFSNYLEDPLQIRTNWDNRFDWKLAKYFSLTVTTNLIYDPKVLNPDGSMVGVQFKESLAFGFTWTIASK